MPFSDKFTDILFNLCRTTIKDLYLPLYSEVVVNYFLSYNQPENIQYDSKIGYTALLFGNNDLVGSGCIVGTNIRRLFVLPNYQRAGFGTLILKHLEQKSVENNCNFLDLYAMINTIDFYKKLGYKEMGICNYIVNKNCSVDYMRMSKYFD